MLRSAAPRDDDRQVSPSALYQVVQALVHCIEGQPSEVAHHLGISCYDLKKFLTSTEKASHAYWEWAVQSIQPAVHLTTVLGRCDITLKRADDRFVETQYMRRITTMLGARCSLEGSKRSVRESQHTTMELLAEPMPAGTIACSDPLHIVSDILVTQRVPISNLPLVTGVPVPFLEACNQGADTQATTAIRSLWSIASRLGCTLTLLNGKRTYVLEPCVAPNRTAMNAVQEGFKRRFYEPREFRSDIDRDIVSSVVQGALSVSEAAERYGVTRQAVQQRLQSHGITMTILKNNARLIWARKILARLLV